jgi:hypothetical protein
MQGSNEVEMFMINLPRAVPLGLDAVLHPGI